MGSEKQENISNKRGIRVTSSVSSRRRLQRKITMKCCRCALQYPNLVDREHDFTSSMAIHAVFIFLNPLMVDLLQVQYQTKTTSPFETHAPKMWIFFVATCVHCLGLALEIKVQSFCKVLSNMVLFSGALSSMSLASVFLPHLVGWICLSLWTILPFSVGFPFLISFFKTLYFKLKHAMAFVAKKPAELVKCITPQKIFLPH